MGRIYSNIDVQGRQSWTLFDSGARNTYVVQEIADLISTSIMPQTYHSALGGSHREITQSALLEGKLEGLPITTHAMVVDSLGPDDNGKPIEILFGALSVQQWGVRLIPEHEVIDMTHYPNEFVEF